MINARRVVLLGVGALAILGSACGGGGDSAAPAPQGNTPGQARNNAGAGSTLVMRDNEFVPSDFSVQARTEITLRNQGQAPHNFTVEGQNIDQDVNPGETETETLELDPGTYDFVCEFHREAGMTGTLTVEG